MFFHVAVRKCCVNTEFSKNFQPCLIAKCLNILFVIYWSLKKEKSDSIEKKWLLPVYCYVALGNKVIWKMYVLEKQ